MPTWVWKTVVTEALYANTVGIADTYNAGIKPVIWNIFGFSYITFFMISFAKYFSRNIQSYSFMQQKDFIPSNENDSKPRFY